MAQYCHGNHPSLKHSWAYLVGEQPLSVWTVPYFQHHRACKLKALGWKEFYEIIP
jgi:hypothetical protein